MKNSSKKTLGIVLALLLVCCISVMGTYAYLTAQTADVTNTFTAAVLDTAFTLDESQAQADANNPGVYTLGTSRVTSNSYTVVPGTTIPKDPMITVTGLGVQAYLFAEVVDSTPATITWTMASDWTKLDGVTGANGGQIYAWNAVLSPNSGDQTFSLIDGNALTVASTYAAPAAGTAENLVFYGYLCQATGFADAAAAFAGCF